MKMPPLNPNDNSNTAVIEDKALSKEDTLEFLSTEDEKPEETLELEKDSKKGPKTVEKEDEEKEVEEEKEGEEEEKEKTLEEELEEELEEPDEEELELITPVRRKEILTKYPTLFKDFPYLEKAYYREQKYTELLPTIADAETAVEKSKILDSYEEEIMDGSTESLLTAVRENDRNSFNKLVDNYLPNLYKVDEDAYYHTIGNIIKHTIISMVRDGKEQSSDELASAANILNQYMFGTDKFIPPRGLAKTGEAKPEDKSREDEIQQRELEFTERQFNSALDSVGTRIDNILKSTVDKNIDPNESMTEYVRRNASREVLESLDNLIENDSRFKTIYDKLWERAFEDNFSDVSMDKIKSAYLSKAKTLLPELIKRSRNEALKGLRRASNEDDINKKDKKGPLPVGRIRSSTSSPNSGKDSVRDRAKAIPKGVSTLDYLNQD
jgi:hypothetical protein